MVLRGNSSLHPRLPSRFAPQSPHIPPRLCPAVVYALTAPAAVQPLYAACMGLLYLLLVAASRTWLVERRYRVSTACCAARCAVLCCAAMIGVAGCPRARGGTRSGTPGCWPRFGCPMHATPAEAAAHASLPFA